MSSATNPAPSITGEPPLPSSTQSLNNSVPSSSDPVSSLLTLSTLYTQSNSPILLSSVVTLASTTFTTTLTSTNSGPTSSTSALTSLPTATGTSGGSSTGSNSTTSNLASQSICVGHGIDNQAIGILGTLILSSVVGLLLWFLFAFARPKFPQVYALRQWFIEPKSRPRPLSNRPWAFLFPHVPFLPAIPKKTDHEQANTPAQMAQSLPSDQELMQRVLWIAFLLCLGWTFLGLILALPLYLINTPCLAQSAPKIHFTGQISTMQDLSLLRLLTLLDNRTITTVSDQTILISRVIANGKDLAPNIGIRLIILTVLSIVLGVLPLIWKLYKEFNKLLRYRELWLSAKCGGLDLAWLSIQKAPGFRGWGEQRLKDFLYKNGLGMTVNGNAASSNGPKVTDQEGSVPGIDVMRVFTIVNTATLQSLITERTQILNHLEEAETKYIASFRMTTPDPSIVGEMTTPEPKPYISRPRVLIGAITNMHRRRKGTSGVSAATPPSFVAPSSYYRLREPKYSRDGAGASDQNHFGQAIHERLTGSRFQEVNRNTNIYETIPLGSPLHVGESGNLEPILENGTKTFSRPQNIVDTSIIDDKDHLRSLTQPLPSERESFPMRQPSRNNAPDPPHLRTQTDRPFVRPLSGIDPEELSHVYENIRHWRSRLKDLNAQVSQAQENAYINISEGTGITGWLLIGRGLRLLPGVEMIEGRSKSDIRWNQLQITDTNCHHLAFWTTVCFIGLLLGAGLIAVTSLALSNAPEVANILTFLQPITLSGSIGASLVITLVPALLLSIFVILALSFIEAAGKKSSSVSVSGAQFSTFKATFYLLTLIAGIWVVAIGALVFALDAFKSGSDRAENVAHGSIYVGGFTLAILLNVAIIAPALLLLQPFHLWRVLRREMAAITPRQRFRARYPAPYNPIVTLGCGTLAVVFAAMFSLIFPLVGPAVVLLLFLTLLAHRYLVGYTYGRGGVGEHGGALQIWLVRRFASIVGLQPMLLGLIFLSQRIWALGGTLVGVGTLLPVATEIYALVRTRDQRGRTLSSADRRALTLFRHISLQTIQEMDTVEDESSNSRVEQGSVTSRERLTQLRSRGSLASVLEMMSITLAAMPSRLRNPLPVPFETEDLDDLTATDRAARRHPAAPPHLPRLAFEDNAKETADLLYPPDMLAEPPSVWLPNDRNGIALAEAYDLQRYHDLAVVLDVENYDNAMTARR